MLMKRTVAIGLVILSVAALAVCRTGSSAAQGAFEVSGDITLSPAGGGKPTRDASKVAVWLTPLASSTAATSTTSTAKYQMLQRNKTFEPALLVIPIGSMVAFPNLDPWFHNVFSLYRGKRFDLGLYQAGDTKYVKFDRPGASYLFCNIHPDMSAIVLTVDSPYFGQSDKAGRVVIPAGPAGIYRMHVWYENADPSALQSLGRDLRIGEADHALPAVSIPLLSRDLHAHKDKYGHEYDKETLAPNY
jgi:plastocyanin